MSKSKTKAQVLPGIFVGPREGGSIVDGPRAGDLSFSAGFGRKVISKAKKVSWLLNKDYKKMINYFIGLRIAIFSLYGSCALEIFEDHFEVVGGKTTDKGKIKVVFQEVADDPAFPFIHAIVHNEKFRKMHAIERKDYETVPQHYKDARHYVQACMKRAKNSPKKK